MVFFGKKEKEVAGLIVKHIQVVGQTLSEFSSLIDAYLKRDKHFKEGAFKVHTLEHEADSLRREVALKLSQGAFLPVYREDYIVLLELIDKIANKAESTGDFIVLTRPRVPEYLNEGIRKMVKVTLDCFEPIENIYELFQKNLDDALIAAAHVEEQEQRVDEIQWQLTKTVFKSELSLAEKNHLKDFIDHIENISDRIEDVSDRFEIMVVKRSL